MNEKLGLLPYTDGSFTHVFEERKIDGIVFDFHDVATVLAHVQRMDYIVKEEVVALVIYKKMWPSTILQGEVEKTTKKFVDKVFGWLKSRGVIEWGSQRKHWLVHRYAFYRPGLTCNLDIQLSAHDDPYRQQRMWVAQTVDDKGRAYVVPADNPMQAMVSLLFLVFTRQ